MPEVLKYADIPGFFYEFHIEPFKEEYIPGSVVLSVINTDAGKVFFQIPTPTHASLDPTQLQVLKDQIHEWWQAQGEPG
jgi:hypothetical protein